MRPLIGITTYVEQAQWGYWDLEAALIPSDYVTAISDAGGRAVLLPPSDDAVEETLEAVDGIVFTGGSDIDPKEYGAEAHPETFGIRADRDSFELALMRAALERDMPVLGVCRGIQVLNVARGGDLHQHLPDLVGHERHKHDPPGIFNDHEVAIEPETRLASILGDTHAVKSHHHQALRTLGEGLVETARADDGTVEAVEDPGRRFALGVLWHPEAGENKRLFEALVEEARRYRAERHGS
jgi:putative glutamine amidotransferase